VLLGLLFLLIRLNLALEEPSAKATDVPIYANLSLERELGARRNIPFYEAHARITRWKARNEPNPQKRDYIPREEVEYPPLAIAFLRLPEIGIPPMPQEQNPPRKRAAWLPTPEQEFAKEYCYRYTFWILPLELALAALVWTFSKHLYPRDRTARSIAVLTYLISTAALWQILYTRLDLVVALLTAGSLFLLVSRLHFFGSFVVLALAVNFKIVPVILTPLWILGSLPACSGADLFGKRCLHLACGRFFMMFGPTLSVFLPFYFADGPDTLSFVDYHAGRGIEVGSVYSFLMMWAAELGSPLEVYFSHGSFNVRSPWSPVLVAVSPFVCGAVLLGIVVFTVITLRRATGAGQPAFPKATFAQTYPVLFVRFTLLMLIAFILTNKVFSPQYMLWLIPFASLLPRQHLADRLSLILFPAACGVTALIFPMCFWDDVIGFELVSEGVQALHGPTPTGMTLLTLRNVLLVGLLVSVVWGIRRDGSVSEASRPKTAAEERIAS
jgi:hypothetical protein